MRSKAVKKMTSETPWKEITPGGTIYEAGNAESYKTGDWRAMRPVWIEEKCTQCMLCPPTCPDVAIPVKDSKRLDFDYDHCKGCGVCVEVCPFDAIGFIKEEDKEE